MDDLKDQSAVSTTATNGVVESEEVRAQEALLGDTDPSLTSADDVAKALNVDPSHGLSEEEAKRRLAKFGPNELASAPPVPKWKKFLAQFQDPLVYLLIAATIISVIAWFIEKANAQPGAEGGEVLPFDAIVIILILIVNAVLGYMQEAKAEAAVEALAQMTAPQTSVLRDGKVMRINTADVVPGDIIVLAEGDSVSADGRLVNAASLRIAEASLTGESVPVGKKPDPLTEAKALGDRANMIFNGTSVTQGTGRAIVTGTGMNTQVGKIADMLSATEDEKTPLQKEMDYVSKILGIAVCVIAVVVLVALIAIWEQLQKCNRVFIVSASIYNWIKPFASDLGIRDILSTEIEVDGEGCLTGFFSNKNCYGQEKVVRLLEQIPDLENNYLIVYGDSKGDSQLLKYANESHYRAL